METLFRILQQYRLWDRIKTIVNIGSCWGEEDAAFAKAFPDARVFSFEPNPEAYPTLLKNVKGHANIFPQNRAVGEVGGTIDFYQSTNRCGTSSMFPTSGVYDCIEPLPARKIQVECVRLDECLSAHGVTEIDLIWADAQGAELAALRSAGTLIDTVKCIFVEVEYKPIYAGQPLYPEVKGFLEGRGFTEVWSQTCVKDFWGEAIFVKQPSL